MISLSVARRLETTIAGTTVVVATVVAVNGIAVDADTGACLSHLADPDARFCDERALPLGRVLGAVAASLFAPATPAAVVAATARKIAAEINVNA